MEKLERVYSKLFNKKTWEIRWTYGARYWRRLWCALFNHDEFVSTNMDGGTSIMCLRCHFSVTVRPSA